MTAQAGVVTLQQALNAASYFLGETTPPVSQNTVRTLFANEAKHAIAYTRNWSWEYTEPSGVNLVASTTSYSLTQTDFKSKNSIDWVKVDDNSGNTSDKWPFYVATTRRGILNAQNNSSSDNLYALTGNNKNGYTLYINPSTTYASTGGILFAYYALEADFVNVTDTTNIQHEEAIGWYIAAKVYLGYREQAQYQLAMEEFNDDLEEMAMMDTKNVPNSDLHIITLREARGSSNNFKTYY